MCVIERNQSCLEKGLQHPLEQPQFCNLAIVQNCKYRHLPEGKGSKMEGAENEISDTFPYIGVQTFLFSNLLPLPSAITLISEKVSG